MVKSIAVSDRAAVRFSGIVGYGGTWDRGSWGSLAGRFLRETVAAAVVGCWACFRRYRPRVRLFRERGVYCVGVHVAPEDLAHEHVTL